MENVLSRIYSVYIFTWCFMKMSFEMLSSVTVSLLILFGLTIGEVGGKSDNPLFKLLLRGT